MSICWGDITWRSYRDYLGIKKLEVSLKPRHWEMPLTVPVAGALVSLGEVRADPPPK